MTKERVPTIAEVFRHDRVVCVDFAGIAKVRAQEREAAKLPIMGVLQCICGCLTWYLRDDTAVTCSKCFATHGDLSWTENPPAPPAA